MKPVTVMSVVLCIVAASAAALAYILPGHFILGKVADQRNTEGLSDFTVEGMAQIPAPGGDLSGEAQLHVSTACCAELRVLAGKRELGMRIKDAAAEPASAELKPLADALAGKARGLLAMFPGRAAAPELAGEIRSLGVDTETTSLARFHGRVAFVLGAPARERTLPQLWIDKDSFHALRLLLPQRAGAKEMLDVKMIDYQNSPLPGRFPRAIEVYSGQALLFRLEADKVYAGGPEDDEDRQPGVKAKGRGM